MTFKKSSYNVKFVNVILKNNVWCHSKQKFLTFLKEMSAPLKLSSWNLLKMFNVCLKNIHRVFKKCSMCIDKY